MTEPIIPDYDAIKVEAWKKADRLAVEFGVTYHERQREAINIGISCGMAAAIESVNAVLIKHLTSGDGNAN